MTPTNAKNQMSSLTLLYDRSLLWTVIGLIVFGVLMVTSASMAMSESRPFFYTQRELMQLALAVFIMLIVLYIPIELWNQYSKVLLLITIVMLIAVLFVGSSIKGASRWIPLGLFNFQPAELSKLALFLYLASYLERKLTEVQRRFWGFLKPMMIILLLSGLLLMQPDLGTLIVLCSVTLGILYIAGAKIWQFGVILSLAAIAIAFLIFFAPYRLVRVITFMDPWKDPTGAGYQLTSSLMAIGNGGLWGQGLGNSVRKLGYLPEAHTDFIFAIIAEELGYIGVICILALLFFLAFKAITIGYRSLNSGSLFSGYLACQIGIWFALQTFINIGVTSGMLPTKGLTLPFISYGGSSLIVMSIAVALLLRIDFEYRRQHVQARVRIKK